MRISKKAEIGRQAVNNKKGKNKGERNPLNVGRVSGQFRSSQFHTLLTSVPLNTQAGSCQKNTEEKVHKLIWVQVCGNVGILM